MTDIIFESVFDVPDDFTGRCIVDDNVNYFLNGRHHRENGPAIEYANGSKRWYIHGEPHRIDGPAMEQGDGFKSFWINGKIHRIDGPAVEHADGSKEWYLNDEKHGEDNDFTNESWILFQRTLLF